MKCKVLLINPSIKREDQYGGFNNLVGKALPLNLGFLAGYLLHKEEEVKIIDEQWEYITREKLEMMINKYQSNIVGISCITPNIYRAFEIAKMTKEISKNIKIIFGNVHPTIFPEESLEKPFVDIVVRGEGEITLWECVQVMEGKKKMDEVLGISYKENGEIIHNAERPCKKNLDFFPRCAFELIIADLPVSITPNAIITSRGCPYSCIFCTSGIIGGRGYRTNSPQRVVDDVEFLIDKYSLKRLFIGDDNFLANRKRVEEICYLFIKRGLHRKINWSCHARGDAIDSHILDIMKQAGCILIHFGIETNSQRLLKLIRKSEKVEDNKVAVRLAHNAGIETRGSFIIGLPTETKRETLETIKFARSLPLDRAKFCLATPYPGTELYNIAINEGVNIRQDWSKLNSMSGLSSYLPIYVPKGRSPKELLRLQIKAHLEFYLRPKHLLTILRGENPEIYMRSYKSIIKYFIATIRLIVKNFF